MGWFSNDKKKKEGKKPLPRKLPDLPKLPHIPDVPELPKLESKDPLPQLPSLPDSGMGNKFSQDMIKEAVTGEKEDGEGDMADLGGEDDLPEFPSMPMPPTKPLAREIAPPEFATAARVAKKAEPVFVRLDKFEDSMQTFEKIKQKISEGEKMLRDIKKVKDAEEVELEDWEREVQALKKQIEKVDADIFSKID
jgi:hypothetical protein